MQENAKLVMHYVLGIFCIFITLKFKEPQATVKLVVNNHI